MWTFVTYFSILSTVISGIYSHISEDNIFKQDSRFWYNGAQTHLDEVLSWKNNENRAKNIIFFVGDGMGISTVTSGRIFIGQQYGLSGEEYKLSFEQFPNAGLSKTYNVNSQVTDSAAGANAMFCGVKTRIKTIGLDAKAPYNHCDMQVNKMSELQSLAVLAQKSGLDTGFVTTTRVTHATPSALYAHSNNRDWECDTDIPRKYRSCVKDIARQLVENETGKNMKVIMGGGDKCICNKPKNCGRKDKLRPAAIWRRNNPDGKIVTNVNELMNVDINNTGKLMGIFSQTHFPYTSDNEPEIPTLTNMTVQAIKMLQKNKNGFFLMVESGKIDLAHHKNKATQALFEMSDFDDAIKQAISMVNLNETLIIVTADHSHGLTINGYPERGNDILGFINVNGTETLTYANGPSHKKKKNKSNNDFLLKQHPAGTYSKKATHSGEDVGVFATGPWSHLLRGTFEQNYIPHVVAYAACFKNMRNHCNDLRAK